MTSGDDHALADIHVIARAICMGELEIECDVGSPEIRESLNYRDRSIEMVRVNNV